MTVFRDNTTGHSSTLVLDKKKKQLFSSQLTVRLQSSVYQCRLISSAFLTFSHTGNGEDQSAQRIQIQACGEEHSSHVKEEPEKRMSSSCFGNE